MTKQVVDLLDSTSKIDFTNSILILKYVSYIHYPVRFRKNWNNIKTPINSSSEVNIIYLAYAKKIGLFVKKTDISAQKIDDFALATFDIVIAAFLVNDKDRKVKFFKKIFLLANISLEVVLGMLFLILSNVDVRFLEQQLLWHVYTTAKALPTTCWKEVIDRKKFIAAALKKDEKAFVIYVNYFFSPED